MMRIPRPTLRLLLAAAALPLGAACNVTDADYLERPLPAIIDIGPPESPQIVVPAEVRAGQSFTVQVTTFGGGCVVKGSTPPASGESSVDLRPYDLHPIDEDAACTRELRAHQHDVTVRLDTPGPGTVRVHGRRMTDDEPVTVTRELTITQ